MAECVVFHRLGPKDGPEVFRVWGDFETVKFTNWAHTATLPECEARLERVLAYYAKDERHFGPYVLRTGSGCFLGLIGAEHSKETNTEYEVWYLLDRAEWGKGFASQAVAALIQQMAQSGRVSSAVATAVSSNPASARVLEKNGFIRGVTEAKVLSRHGQTEDLIHFSRAGSPAPTPPGPKGP